MSPLTGDGEDSQFSNQIDATGTILLVSCNCAQRIGSACMTICMSSHAFLSNDVHFVDRNTITSSLGLIFPENCLFVSREKLFLVLILGKFLKNSVFHNKVY